MSSLKKAVLLGSLLAMPIVLILVLVARSGTLSPCPDKLSAEFVLSRADIGIPGISNWYELRVTNRWKLPLLVEACDFIDDAGAPGSMLAYSVQRWDESKQDWATVANLSGPHYCEPYPLGIIKARTRNKTMWPGESMQFGGEATEARGPFRLGDSLRFVVYSRLMGPGVKGCCVIPTGSFQITERPTDSGQYRIRH